jgi:hypothetical protein
LLCFHLFLLGSVFVKLTFFTSKEKRVLPSLRVTTGEQMTQLVLRFFMM